MSPPESESCQNGAVAASVPPVVADEETMAQVAMIVDAIAFPMTMQAALELGLLEIIAAAGPGAHVTAEEIAEKLPAKENPQAADMVDRILRLLAAFSVVSCTVVGGGDGERRKAYGMTPAAKYFVKDEEGLSMGGLLKLIQDKVFVESWYKLKDAVLEGGIPFNKAHGMNAFEYPGVDQRFNEVFNLAMFNHTSIIMKKILESYKGFENINELLDVGGGLGHNLQIILSKYPKIKGTNFDLPHVTKHGIAHPGMEHVGGDMFESIPSAEAIFMKWILHDWGNDYCLKLLKNCHKALPDNGKVVVVEAIVSEESETTNIAKALCEMDMMMMTQNPGGKERTKKEFLDLAKAAGFAGIRFECYVCNLWIMEFYKYKLKDAVLEGGIPFNKAHGMNAFEYPGVDQRFNEVFNLAMFNHTSIIMKKILESYKGFENINELLDVGGGLGHNLRIILSKYPKIKGTNFDLPHVTKHGIAHPGMEHVGGDMFESIPTAEAIFMKWILHDWGNDYCLKLLKNCHKAIPDNGKVIVVEAIVSEEPETTNTAKALCEMDMIMMTQNPGGKERTKKEFLDLAKAAGFAGIRFECYVCNLWIMEFYK